MDSKKSSVQISNFRTELLILLPLLTLSVIVLFAGRYTVRRVAFAVTLCLLVLTGYLAILHFRRERRFLRKLSSLLQGEDESEDGTTVPPMRGIEMLELLQTRLYESASEGALKTEAELHALQNQINPHFLYNTLEMIRSSALRQGNQDVAEMVESLALQFRYCINNQGELATLQQELDHVHNYLLIQRYRFGDRIRYEECLPEDDQMLMNCKLPILTLQPIIENSLVHGISPQVEGGCITLRVRASSMRLYISVEDDGIGIPESELKVMRQRLQDDIPVPREGSRKHSSGIALSNVNRRIHLYFGKNYGVEVTSTVGMGTSVSLVLPILGAE